MTWREHCKPIIAQVLAENKGRTDKEIKKALFDAYPYGERAMHPYKIWNDEIKVQTGKKKTNPKGSISNENQQSLF